MAAVMAFLVLDLVLDFVLDRVNAVTYGRFPRNEMRETMCRDGKFRKGRRAGSA